MSKKKPASTKSKTIEPPATEGEQIAAKFGGVSAKEVRHGKWAEAQGAAAAIDAAIAAAEKRGEDAANMLACIHIELNNVRRHILSIRFQAKDMVLALAMETLGRDLIEVEKTMTQLENRLRPATTAQAKENP
jgi:hypothetical protein